MIRKTFIALACASVFAASAFAATPSLASPASQSRKVVQMGNDVVVVSLVAAAGHKIADNVGIERYDAAGQPVAWQQSTSWTDAKNQHIVFPSSAWHFTAIRDVQVFKDHLWILVDSSNTDERGQVQPTADILAFDSSGQFKGGRFGVIRAGESRDVIGAGMLFQPAGTPAGADRLLVAAACPDVTAGVDDRLCVQNYLLSTQDQWYPTFANDGEHAVASWSLKTAGASQ